MLDEEVEATEELPEARKKTWPGRRRRSWRAPGSGVIREGDEDVEEVEVAPFHSSGGRVGGHGDSGGGRQVRR